MKTRTLITAIAIVATIAAAGLAIAQVGPGGGLCTGQGPMGGGAGPGGGPGGFGPGGGPDDGPGFLRMLDRLGDVLNLSAEQQEQIEAIVTAQQPAIEALRDQLEANRDSFRDSVEPGQFDETELRTHAEAQAALMVDMKVLMAKVKAQVFSVLTEQQQQQLLELREQRASCGKRGHGHGHGHGKGFGHGRGFGGGF